MIPYELKLNQTTSGRGFFACSPPTEMDFDTCRRLLEDRPFDDFLRLHLLERIQELGPAGWDRLRARNDDARPALRSLLYEASLLYPALHDRRSRFSATEIRRMADDTPLIYIKSEALPDQRLHRAWNRFFAANFFHHRPLPAPEKAGLDLLFPPADDPTPGEAISRIERIREHVPPTPGRTAETVSADAVADLAAHRLGRLGVLDGGIMRHEASLSPVALLQRWHVDVQVSSGRHRHRIHGRQTAYGKGLDLPAARASCLMEVVERFSSFASFENDAVVGYRTPLAMVHARYSELAAAGKNALDPNLLCLEAPYRDEPLYWVEGRQCGGETRVSCLVPAQCVFLFCNLDEISLFSSLGSTGLASGMTTDEAETAALLEVVERDSEAVSPFHPDNCFSIETGDPALAALLTAYRQKGIHLQFQDLTGPLGIPCCKSFVRGADGLVAWGTGAHLTARRALISAMVEVPYPFPSGPPSAAADTGHHIRVPLEGTPDYSTGHPESDRRLLECLLQQIGCPPVYVQLTRSDLDIPVVRAIVPGMEMMADFDRTARVSRRLFQNYLALTRQSPDSR